MSLVPWMYVGYQLEDQSDRQFILPICVNEAVMRESKGVRHICGGG